MRVRVLTCLAAATCVALFGNASLSAQGLDIGAVLARWDSDEHPDLRGVVVLHGGRLFAERYYNGANKNELHDIRSAGKSVTALLAGIAIDRGAIRSLEDPVATYWHAAKGSAIGAASLRDVLTMRSGLAAFDQDPASPGNEDRMDASTDPLAYLRSIPASDPPGKVYRYNSATAYGAGVVIAQATGMPMSQYARRTLFKPLGIHHWRWDADAAGVTKGQGNLWLSARSLAAIGEMVRAGGTFRGQRIVSAKWVTQMLAPSVNIAAQDAFADGYGYFWYSKRYDLGDKGLTVSFASGNGGNKIYIVPTCKLVVSITSSAYGRGYGQRRSEAILKAVLASQMAGGNCAATKR